MPDLESITHDFFENWRKIHSQWPLKIHMPSVIQKFPFQVKFCFRCCIEKETVKGKGETVVLKFSLKLPNSAGRQSAVRPLIASSTQISRVAFSQETEFIALRKKKTT